MKLIKLTVALGMAMTAGSVYAAGFNHAAEVEGAPVPLKWDTSNGPIPVYTDGGGAFTYDYDGVTPFITIERANEITAFAYEQWSNVSTSTFEAEVVGSIHDNFPSLPEDVTGANAEEIYDELNGYGFFVLYDTDGSILEEYFGVPRDAVLGIAFPEWAEDDGTIIEATAVMNGWYVWDHDTEGNMVAGVFTHEFGHTINLSHAQANGHSNLSNPWAPLYPGVSGCGVNAWDRYAAPIDPYHLETMYPFINHGNVEGEAMSYVSMPDDIASISTLYPTPDFHTETGSIAGTLYLKDGTTGFPGVNVIARSVSDPMGNVVSAITGHQTLGMIGPDGSYVINGLTPGMEYEVYIEQIVAGGFPVQLNRLASVSEYWNDAESHDPAVDNYCESTPITVEAGVTHTADVIFNGYFDGIQYTPIIDALLVDLSKNGRMSAGQFQSIGFTWDMNHGIKVLPPEIRVGNASINRNGSMMTVQYDHNGNGVGQATLLDYTGNSNKGNLVSLGDLNGGECGGSGAAGENSSYAWAVDDAGHTVVGTAYKDHDGDGSCQEPGWNSTDIEVMPFIWTKDAGMRRLDTSSIDTANAPWVRAQAVSGDGSVVLGSQNGWTSYAWINEGPVINLSDMFGVSDAWAMNYDGTRVALLGSPEGLKLWNAHTNDIENIGGLTWCVDMDYVFWGMNYCDMMGPEAVQEMLGPIQVSAFDMSDKGDVIIGRAGDFWNGFVGAIWIEGIGWMSLPNFFGKQGVAEAQTLPVDNPISIDATGNNMVAGLAGAYAAWYIDMTEVYVCRNGKDMKTSFPQGMLAQIERGAEFGRCAFID